MINHIDHILQHQTRFYGVVHDILHHGTVCYKIEKIDIKLHDEACFASDAL